MSKPCIFQFYVRYVFLNHFDQSIDECGLQSSQFKPVIQSHDL
jgi:hypothetical protein